MQTRNRTLAPPTAVVRADKTAAGFTIIEVLIALTLLVTVLAISTTPIINAFSMTAKSKRTVSGNSAAQQVLEVIRGQWQTQTTYDNTCVTNYALPSGATVTVSAFDTRYTALSTPTFAASATATCSGTSSTAPIKRVTVTVTSNSATQAVATLEIAR